jgi:hypothetical protein
MVKFACRALILNRPTTSSTTATRSSISLVSQIWPTDNCVVKGRLNAPFFAPLAGDPKASAAIEDVREAIDLIEGNIRRAHKLVQDFKLRIAAGMLLTTIATLIPNPDIGGNRHVPDRMASAARRRRPRCARGLETGDEEPSAVIDFDQLSLDIVAAGIPRALVRCRRAGSEDRYGSRSAVLRASPRCSVLHRIAHLSQPPRQLGEVLNATWILLGGSRFNIGLDMGKLFLQSLALGGKVGVGDAWVL